MIVKPSIRRTDDFGSGHFGASRGSRVHNGVDFLCAYGSVVLSPIPGHITKLGYPYADDLNYRYVEIVSYTGRYHRIFYVMPLCDIGDVVCEHTEIGTVQDISKRYDTKDKMMLNHIHYSIHTIEDGIKVYIDPEEQE